MGLVIRRKKGESFTIGNAEITIDKFESGGKVKLYIKAPLDMVIKRDNIKNDKPKKRN